jgi:hypothetical protein
MAPERFANPLSPKEHASFDGGHCARDFQHCLLPSPAPRASAGPNPSSRNALNFQGKIGSDMSEVKRVKNVEHSE